jgi:hypothetical protein
MDNWVETQLGEGGMLIAGLRGHIEVCIRGVWTGDGGLALVQLVPFRVYRHPSELAAVAEYVLVRELGKKPEWPTIIPEEWMAELP